MEEFRTFTKLSNNVAGYMAEFIQVDNLLGLLKVSKKVKYIKKVERLNSIISKIFMYILSNQTFTSIFFMNLLDLNPLITKMSCFSSEDISFVQSNSSSILNILYGKLFHFIKESHLFVNGPLKPELLKYLLSEHNRTVKSISIQLNNDAVKNQNMVTELITSNKLKVFFTRWVNANAYDFIFNIENISTSVQMFSFRMKDSFVNVDKVIKFLHNSKLPSLNIVLDSTYFDVHEKLLEELTKIDTILNLHISIISNPKNLFHSLIKALSNKKYKTLSMPFFNFNLNIDPEKDKILNFYENLDVEYLLLNVDFIYKYVNLDQVYKSIFQNSKIKVLHIEHLSELVPLDFRTIEKCTTKKLILNGRHVGLETFELLSLKYGYFKKYPQIELSGLVYEEFCHETFLNILKSFESLKDISYVSLKHFGIPMITLNNCPVEELKLKSCEFDGNEITNYEAEKKYDSSLTKLSLMDVKISPKQLYNLLSGQKNIQTLELVNCTFDNDGISYISKFINENGYLSIEKLILKHYTTIESDITELIQSLREIVNLKVIDFCGTHVESDGVSLLVDLINESNTLEEINMSVSRLKEIQSLAILDAVENSKSIKLLNISKNFILGNAKEQYYSKALKYVYRNHKKQIII